MAATGATIVQLGGGNWTGLPKIALHNIELLDSQSPTDETTYTDTSASRVGLWVAAIGSETGRIAVKLGYGNITGTNVKDLAPLKIRWIP